MHKENIEKAWEYFNGVASAWNGEDLEFTYEDKIYTSDQAILALDIADSLEHAKNLLDQWDF